MSSADYLFVFQAPRRLKLNSVIGQALAWCRSPHRRRPAESCSVGPFAAPPIRVEEELLLRREFCPRTRRIHRRRCHGRRWSRVCSGRIGAPTLWRRGGWSRLVLLIHAGPDMKGLRRCVSCGEHASFCSRPSARHKPTYRSSTHIYIYIFICIGFHTRAQSHGCNAQNGNPFSPRAPAASSP